MNPKDRPYFVIVIALILLLSGVSYWQFKNWEESLKEIKLEGLQEGLKIEMPELELPFQEDSEEEKEFVSEDGKLKLKYDSSWMETGKESLEILNKEGAKILLFAQKFKGASLSFLIVQEMNLENEKSFEEFVEEMKKEAEKTGTEMEIIKLETKNGENYLEARYKKGGGYDLHSKERIIFSEKKVYLISFLTFDKDFGIFIEEADSILKSAEVMVI